MFSLPVPPVQWYVPKTGFSFPYVLHLKLLLRFYLSPLHGAKVQCFHGLSAFLPGHPKLFAGGLSTQDSNHPMLSLFVLADNLRFLENADAVQEKYAVHLLPALAAAVIDAPPNDTHPNQDIPYCFVLRDRHKIYF